MAKIVKLSSVITVVVWIVAIGIAMAGYLSGNAIAASMNLPGWSLWNPFYILGHLSPALVALILGPVIVCGGSMWIYDEGYLSHWPKNRLLMEVLIAGIALFSIGMALATSIWLVIAVIIVMAVSTFLYHVIPEFIPPRK